MAAGQAPEALQADASIMHIACSGLSDTSDGTASRCKRISPLPPGLNQRAALLTAPLFNAKTAGVLQEVGGAPHGTRRPDSVPPMGCGSSARLAATSFAARRPAAQGPAPLRSKKKNAPEEVGPQTCRSWRAGSEAPRQQAVILGPAPDVFSIGNLL